MRSDFHEALEKTFAGEYFQIHARDFFNLQGKLEPMTLTVWSCCMCKYSAQCLMCMSFLKRFVRWPLALHLVVCKKSQFSDYNNFDKFLLQDLW